jgi:hypothetical protein
MRHAIAGRAVNTTYTDVGSADIAYVQGWTVVGQRRSSCRGAAKRCAEEHISVIPVSSTAASLLLTDLQ